MKHKMFWLSIALLIGWVATALGQTQQQTVDALEGLDPVLLAQGKEAQGELKIAVTRGQFRYLFVNEANKAAFERDPARYEIQLDGHCARMGVPTRGIADLYAVHQGRIYIFGSEQCKTLFVAAPEKYLPPASTGLSATPEMLQKGQALIEKAVVAMGGATRLDGLSSYHEKSYAAQTRGANGGTEVKVEQDLLIAFPDRLRFTQTMPDFRDPTKTMQQTLVLLPGEAFGLGGPRGVFLVQKSVREAEERRFRQQPLYLMRARKSPGFKAAALGTEKSGTVELERVAVEFDGVSCVLGIESATGRVLSLSYTRRGRQGAFGEFVQMFSDFREVNGLTLPFKITATFDGQPWKEQSATIEVITINEAVDATLFERPKVTAPN
jgi:YHS domain-containing protein